jgi:hypothetical protein
MMPAEKQPVIITACCAKYLNSDNELLNNGEIVDASMV